MARPEKTADTKLPQFVDSMVEVGSKQLVELLSVDEDQARSVMRQVAHEICKLHARTLIYVPLDVKVEISARDERLWAEYGQDSAKARKYSPERVAELAVSYGMTTAWVYNIVRMMRERQRAAEAAEFAARQGVLALGEGE